MKSVLFGMRKNGWVVAVVLLCLVGGELAANEKELTWHRHEDTTCPDATITGWHTTGTSILKTDNDGGGTADVACDTTLTKKGATDGAWKYTGGDDKITTLAECNKAFDGMTKDCAVVTSIVISGSTKNAAARGDNILMSSSAAKPAILAHEVGHLAGNGDLNPTVTLRIMNYSTATGNENRVSCTERDNYLGL